jgi:alkylation response protein AidB-like acyl-CoA dehydrogenase
MAEIERFREEARSWLEAACPASMREPAVDDTDDVWGGRRATFKSVEQRAWLERMAERGWTAPTWPKEYGGAGLDAAHAAVVDEEMKRLGCRPPLKSLGVWMLGPVLLAFGSDEQKREHLPKMARGEIRWCQGYSEPGAGSDLASLQTRAVLDGDEYVVDGQKVWTSHANLADFIFCLVRTDPNAKKHEGISFLLVDMQSPGVRAKPIKLISGASPFCETFFEGVRVPAKNLVGRPNGGWTVAKAVLEHERALISRMRDARASEDEPLGAMAARFVGRDESGRIAEPALRDRIADADIDALALRYSLRRAADATEAGRPPSPETSTFKLCATEASKRRLEIAVAIKGFQALGWSGDGYSADEIATTRAWLRSRASSIEGGSSEIQLNIIAKRVLGLPD